MRTRYWCEGCSGTWPKRMLVNYFLCEKYCVQYVPRLKQLLRIKGWDYRLITETKNKMLNLVLNDRESRAGQAQILSAEQETELRATGGKYAFWDWGTFRGGDGMTAAVEAGFSEIFAVWLACCYRGESTPDWLMFETVADWLPYRDEFKEARCQWFVG